MSDTTLLETKARELDIETGVKREDREQLAEHLNKALAGTYVLYTKTQLYHWNVVGPLFYSVHKLTEGQYEDMAGAIDEIAERIRSIGFSAHGSLAKLISNSVVSDSAEDTPSAREMVAELAADHQKLALQLRDAVEAADGCRDVYTADLLTARIGVHEEAAWMLEALLVQ